MVVKESLLLSFDGFISQASRATKEPNLASAERTDRTLGQITQEQRSKANSSQRHNRVADRIAQAPDLAFTACVQGQRQPRGESSI